MLQHRYLTGRIGLAIEVHRTAGPRLLGAVYSESLSHELNQAGIPFQREIPVPVVYRPRRADHRLRLLWLPRHR
jgi:GxxExxY protein